MDYAIGSGVDDLVAVNLHWNGIGVATATADQGLIVKSREKQESGLDE